MRSVKRVLTAGPRKYGARRGQPGQQGQPDRQDRHSRFTPRAGDKAISANPDQDEVITDEVFCDTGDKVTGGGWELGANPSPNVQVLASHQWNGFDGTSGWRVQVFNHSTTTSYELFVQIRCADIA